MGQFRRSNQIWLYIPVEKVLFGALSVDQRPDPDQPFTFSADIIKQSSGLLRLARYRTFFRIILSIRCRAKFRPGHAVPWSRVEGEVAAILDVDVFHASCVFRQDTEITVAQDTATRRSPLVRGW